MRADDFPLTRSLSHIVEITPWGRCLMSYTGAIVPEANITKRVQKFNENNKEADRIFRPQ
jgi:hypothetical protein